jgi:hypothetical protein
MSKSTYPDCNNLSKDSCSGCFRVKYCSISCQKLDWKSHKSMCSILKKFSNKVQPFKKVLQIVNEVILSNKREDVRVLEHLLLYAEYQFGE